MKTVRGFGAVLALAALAAGCADSGPVAPLDETQAMDQEAELALSVLGDDMATEAALALADASAETAQEAGRGMARANAANARAAQARLRFQEAVGALQNGDRQRARTRAEEARRLVVQALSEAGGLEAMQASVERIEDLEDAVQADPAAYDEADQLLRDLSMLRQSAARQWDRGDREGAAATGVLAEQRHRQRHRLGTDVADRQIRARLMVEFAATAVGLAERLLQASDEVNEVQQRFLKIAVRQLRLAEAALESGHPWRAAHLAQRAQWNALKAVVLPGGVTIEEARELYELASNLYEQAVEAVGDDPTELERRLLARAKRLLDAGADKVSDGVIRGVAAIWQSAVISLWILS